MATHSEDEDSDGVAMARGAMTATAVIEENIDLDENDISRTTTPIDSADMTSEGNAELATTTTVEKPYSAFSESKKWFIVTLAAVGATTSWVCGTSIRVWRTLTECRPIGSNIFVPAIPTMSDAFGVSKAKINLTIAVYL